MQVQSQPLLGAKPELHSSVFNTLVEESCVFIHSYRVTINDFRVLSRQVNIAALL